MTGDITSPSNGSQPHAIATMTARQEWRRFGRFLAWPQLPQHIAPISSGMGATVRMLMLDFMFVGVFIAILLTIVAMGLDLPENLNSTLEMNLSTILLIVVAAPVLEELLFRSWLSGKPGYLAAFAILLVAGLVAAMQGAGSTGEEAEIGVGLAILAGLILAVIAAILLRKSAAPQWFRTIFPGLFWLSSLGFALVHLGNYTEGALWVLLPLVIPQFVLGSVAGYMRVHYGLIFAILIHALHNGFALSIAALAMSAEGAG